MHNSIKGAEADDYGIKSEYIDPSKVLHLGGEEKIQKSVFRSNSFEKESSSDDVDIKHEPLEPDVEHYVSIPAGVMEAPCAEVV